MEKAARSQQSACFLFGDLLALLAQSESWLLCKGESEVKADFIDSD